MIRSLHREELSEIRTKAAALHARLLAEARVEYAYHHDHLPTPGELLQLAAYDEEFAWLRPLTRLISDLDEKLEHEELSDEDVAQAQAAIAQLITGEATLPA
jgi:hypothetical protein